MAYQRVSAQAGRASWARSISFPNSLGATLEVFCFGRIPALRFRHVDGPEPSWQAVRTVPLTPLDREEWMRGSFRKSALCEETLTLLYISAERIGSDQR